MVYFNLGSIAFIRVRKAFDISTDRQTLSNYLELVKFMNGI